MPVLDDLMYIGETPWTGLGTKFEKIPTSTNEIVEGAKLDWDVNLIPMKSDIHDHIMNYHAVYREDNNQVLGVVNTPNPTVVQNYDTFNAFDRLMKSNDIELVTASSCAGGAKVFGCFKINEEYKVADDDFQHYIVVINDHLKADGKVTVLNTPVRVICQNALSQALSSSLIKYRIKCIADDTINENLAQHILNMEDRSRNYLIDKAADMINKKVSRQHIDKILDELFPYIKSTGDSTHDKANERTELMRNTFIEKCLGADNLANYAGTEYQVFNALTDFFQHYHSKPENGLDLDKRMNLLPGFGTSENLSKVNTFMKNKDKWIA